MRVVTRVVFFKERLFSERTCERLCHVFVREGEEVDRRLRGETRGED